jgi:bifunctional non-homologous end joining protein LigD
MMSGLHSTLGATTTRRRDLTLPAGFIPPCLPMMAPRPPSGPFWLHEIKHDGFRIIARNESRRVRLYDRLGNDLTQRFPLIVAAMARLPSCTIDGEAVVCDESGVPSFDLLGRRQRDDQVFLYAFDLIELARDDRRRDPLEQRKADLNRLLADASPGLVLNNWIDGDKFDGTTVLEHVCSAGLEGIVSKRKDSRYISGRSPYWLKMKNPTREAVRREAADVPVIGRVAF